uniref:Uncharacterized protein n=1 Tax=Trypanosoma congolense (strain IL3000) TaxID=1068625 RepID=G0ULU0_TRYCI|nr:conserved hypothetical protein [Trypanosoma congolense IL3000]
MVKQWDAVVMPPSTRYQNNIEMSLRRRLSDTQRLAQLRLQRVVELKDEIARLREILSGIEAGPQGADSSKPAHTRSAAQTPTRRGKSPMKTANSKTNSSRSATRKLSVDRASSRGVTISPKPRGGERSSFAPPPTSARSKATGKNRSVTSKTSRDPSPSSRRSSSANRTDAAEAGRPTSNITRSSAVAAVQPSRQSVTSAAQPAVRPNGSTNFLGRRPFRYNYTTTLRQDPMGEHLSTSESIFCRNVKLRPGNLTEE